MPPPLPPLPSDSEKLSVVWYRYYLELPNLFIILGSKMQLIGIGYLQANPLQAKKSTRTRATASGESPDLMTGITNDIFCSSNSKIYQKEPGDNKTLLWWTDFVSPLALRYLQIPLYLTLIWLICMFPSLKIIIQRRKLRFEFYMNL